MKKRWVVACLVAFAAVDVVVVRAILALPSVEQLGASETVDGIDVPTIGTVGDFPEPKHRHVVNVVADGRVVVEGKDWTMQALLDELKRRGDLDRGDLIPGTNNRHLSNARVVLRLDGSLPWLSAQRAIQVCAEAMIWQMCFAVRSESDGSEGALGFRLPKDKCEDPGDRAWKEVEIGPGTGGSPAALAAALAQSPASLTGKLGVELGFDPRTPTRVVLQTIDAAIRSGAVAVRLRCGGAPRDRYAGFAAEVARLGPVGSGYAVTIGGQVPDVASPAPAMPPVPRRTGEALIPSLGFEMRVEPTDELGAPLPLPLPPWPK